MDRPASIVAFERLYLGSFAIWLIGTLAFWTQLQHNIAVAAAHAPPNVARTFPGIVDSVMVLIGVVTLLLWFLTARKANLVAAWVVIVTESLGALFLIYGLVKRSSAGVGFQANSYVNLAATILAIAAAAFLLRADAQQWLKGKRRAPGIETL